MKNISFLLAVLTLPFLLTACKKETKDQDDTLPNPTPDLCAETDNSDDGILDDLLKTWTPVGATFYGNHLPEGCVDTLCPEIEFTFRGDSTYLLNMTLVVQDSSGAYELDIVENGLYYVKDGDCRQWGNSWDGYYMERDGKIFCSPDGGDAYEISFLLFRSGVFFTSSTRDSTFQLFLH